MPSKQFLDLSDHEKQEVIRFLEDNKPLPEKYRFLLFEDKREVELVWNGKTNEVTNVVLPFQVIEQVDEPRAEKDVKMQGSLFDWDESGRQISGWTNKLIWGDNKLILSSLKNGPLREEIEAQGGIKLIYIDPPFDVGADFSMDIEIGDEQFTKQPSILEELAYRDTWGKGADSFIAMIYERLSLMHDLLADDGSIYVHCDWRVSGYIRITLDEVFGDHNFLNEIVWHYEGPQSPSPKKFGSKHDTIYRYAKDSNKAIIEKMYHFETEVLDVRKYKKDSNGYYYTIPKGDYTDASIARLDSEGLVEWNSNGNARLKRYLQISADGKNLLKEKKTPDVWNITSLGLAAGSNENVGYPTQKPKALLRRIMEASSRPGDIVLDVFMGSGTTIAVAEELSRKWIGSDLGKFSIHTTRKRMIGVQRELKAAGKDYRAFEILNLGKYERQHYVGINHDLRDEEKQKQLALKERAFVQLILQAYKAEEVQGFKTFVGKKANRLVAIGPINLPVSRQFVEEIIQECLEMHLTQVDVLAFEFEMGLFPAIQEEAKQRGIDVMLKYIPRDVFDKRAIEKNQVVFNDVSYIEVKPHIKAKSIAIELTDFSVFYTQDTIANVEASLANGKNKIAVDNGQIIKISKDTNGITTRELLTKKWTDWIDYWSVDFDFASKKEFIRTLRHPELDSGSNDYQETWTGNYIFENEWQSFRTKKDRSLELTTVFQECLPGKRKIAIKVVDIFGNDTMKVIEVTI